jgi:type II secretory pathway component GspD/PulD (secretin)
MNRTPILCSLLALTLCPLSRPAAAQSDLPAGTTDCSKLSTHTEQADCRTKYAQTKTIFLSNVAGQNDANEILIDVRNNFDPSLKVYLLSTQNAITVTTYPEELAKIEAFIHTLDRPLKLYRLTYTLAEYENGKSIGTQHVSLVVADGQRATLKQGDKIPVATGTYNPSSSASEGTQTQFTYLDVGLNFDATLNEVKGGGVLKSKVEESSVGQSNTIAGVQEPVVRQSVIEQTAVLTTGKPVMLGSIDIPNSTRHMDIDVVMDEVK